MQPKTCWRTSVFHMEKDATWPAKTPTTLFLALRKPKPFGTSNLEPQTSPQCPHSPMKPRHIELLFGRPANHFGIVKLLLLLSLTIVLSLNIISCLFNYPFLGPPILNFSSFSFTSNSNSSSLVLDSYSHNSKTSLPPPDSNFSSHPPTIVDSPPPQVNTHSQLSQQPSSDFISPPSSPSPPPQPQPSPNLITSFGPLPPPPPPLPLPSLNPTPPPSPSLNPPPLPSPPTNINLPSPSNLNTGNSISRRQSKDCDLSKGGWVRDWNAPYYTNMTCYTIQEHQNCMKFGRPDTDFLKWRWKPDGCELPLFDPAQFLELMRGKTLAFVGDSLARNQMQSLLCLLSRVVYPEDISETPDENFKRMHYSAYNFTVRTFWAPFLIRANQTRGPGSMTLWNFYLDEVDATWASHIDEFDYLIISGGNWFNRPSIFYHKRRIVGCLYCPSKKVTHRTMHYSNKKAFHTAFQAITKSNKFKGTVILRTVSPAHFENGVWDKGGDCVRTRPFGRNETHLSDEDVQLYKDQVKEFQTAKREGRKKGMDFRLLDTTNAMLQRPDGHPSRYGHWPQDKVTLYNDCVHWCLPGPIDMWNDVLLEMLSF